jgi:hypothetical protein
VLQLIDLQQLTFVRTAHDAARHCGTSGKPHASNMTV